jgi:predicted anti-sigma-YlaC factor YlaD
MKNRLALVGFVVALPACNMSEMSVNLTAPVLKEASAAFASESDLQLARDAAPGQIKTLDGFLVASPKNRDLLEVCAQSYVEYTFGFLEDDLEAMPDDDKHAAERKALTARATDLYDRALGFALRLIATRDDHFGDAFKKDVASTEAAAKKLDQHNAPGLLYAGLALASAINLNRNDVARVVDLPKATTMIKRSHELDPKFHNANAAMVLGLIYASQGKAMGGNPELAKKYFDEAIANTQGKFLLIQVMMARFYAVVTQDRPLFESTLKKVIDAPADLNPAQRLPNETAKKRARRYLAHVEDYF